MNLEDQRDAAIRELVERLQETQSQPEPFLALHTADTIVVNFVGRRVLGRDQLGDAMKAALATSLAQVTTTNEIHDIRVLRPDVAIVSCTKHVSDQRGAATNTTSGSLTYVVINDDGEWRVALAQTTPIADP